MKKSLLIFPLVVVLGLTGCKKVNKQSAKSADFEDLTITDKLTQDELKAFRYNMATAQRGVKNIEYSTYSLDETKENSSSETLTISTGTFYSNAYGMESETTKVTVASGGLQTLKEESSAEQWVYLKGLHALSVSEDSKEGFSMSIRNTFADEDAGVSWMKDQPYSSAIGLISKVNTDADGGLVDRFGKDGDGVIYFCDSISESYSYAQFRSELDVHTVTREQWIARFNAAGELKGYQHVKEVLSNKAADTNKIVDDLDFKSVSKDIVSFSYGELSAGTVPEKFADLAILPTSNMKVTAKWSNVHAETHATTDFAEIQLNPSDVNVVKWTSKNGGRLSIYAHMDTGDCMLVKGEIEASSRKYNAETKKFDDAKYCDRVAFDLSEAYAAKGFEAKACSDDATVKFIEFKDDVNLYFNADFALDANGVISFSNISLAFLTE